MHISRNSRALHWAIGASVLIGLAMLSSLFVAGSSALDEYPDCPFEPIPLNAPRILPVREFPSEKEDRAKYRQEREQVRNYLKSEGAERDASQEERAALDALFDDQPIRARELAEKILRDSPHSHMASFVRAKVIAEGAGNPASALYQIRQARHRFESLGHGNPRNVAAREWYLRFLDIEYDVLIRLGDDENALRCVDRIEQIYEPMPWLKTWPLLRLRRFDEAATTIAATKKDSRWSSTVINNEAVLLLMTNQRLGAYEGFKRYTEVEADSSVAWRNLADSALALSKVAEAEQAFLTATKHEHSYSSKSSFTELARIYIQQGRFNEAADALKQGRASRGRRHFSRWFFDQSDVDETLALLLLATNHSAEAESVARRAYERPNQHGTTSRSESTVQLRNSTALYRVLLCRIAELREKEAFQENPLQLAIQRHQLEAECWVLRTKMRSLMDQVRLNQAFRPYMEDAIDPWQVGDLLPILPNGAASLTLKNTRALEKLPVIEPYLDAYESELAWIRGNSARASELATRALAGLPVEAEKLLRARLQAIAALEAFERDDIVAGLSQIDSVLDVYPVVLRLLDVRLPVNFDHDGSSLAKRLADCLSQSPRLKVDPRGLRIQIRQVESDLVVDLLRLTDARHLSVKVSTAKRSQDEIVRIAAAQFHDDLSTPTVSLDQSTINSINGSPLAVRERESIGNFIDKLQAD